jgi:methyl-accepting chemotaxis protein
VEGSFERLKPRVGELAGRFYERLFEAHPQLRTAFPADLTQQRQKVAAALTLAVSHLRRPEVLQPVLVSLGRRHAGASPAQFVAVGNALLETLAELEGHAWTAALRSAWARTYERIAAGMMQGVSETEATQKKESDMKARPATNGTNGAGTGERRFAPSWMQDEDRRDPLALMRAVVESSPNPTMVCDRDLVIRFANPIALRTLQRLEAYLPVKVAQIVGSSVDIFHKNPAHQRQLLSDPRNLPHQARIKLGPETLELKV